MTIRILSLKKSVILRCIKLFIKTHRFMSQDLVTVKIFNYPSDTPIVQSYMTMKGIDVYMKNLVLNQLSYPIGSIEMQVRQSDYEQAKEALIEGGFAKPEDFK